MIANVVVRLATLADAADIAAMSRDCVEHGLPWNWREARVAHAIADRRESGRPGVRVETTHRAPRRAPWRRVSRRTLPRGFYRGGFSGRPASAGSAEGAGGVGSALSNSGPGSALADGAGSTGGGGGGGGAK